MNGVQAPATTSAGPAATPPQPAASMQLSLLRYSPALVILAILLTDAFRMADPDLWGHVRFGQMFLASGHVSPTDPFNYSVPGHLWLHHEWLAEALMGWLYNHLGAIGLKLLKFTCSAAIVCFVTLAIAETGASILTQLGVLLLTALAVTLEMQFRPQMFDFAFFSAIVWLLTRDNYRRSAPLWIAIPMFILWSNLHGGFFVGLLAIALYGGVRGAQDLIAGRGPRRAVRIEMIAAIGFLATFVNPLGVETWRTIAVSLGNPMTARVMADWRPLLARLASEHFPSVTSVYCLYALALMGALAILLVLIPAAGDLPMVAIAALMSAAAFQATRNISLAAIAIASPLARRISVLASRRRAPGAADAAPSLAARSRGNEIVVLILALVIASETGLFTNRIGDLLWSPVGAVAFMDEHGLHGNILNEFLWGQYLIWHCAPQSKIFIDGRFDLVYPPEVIRDYVSFLFDQPEAGRVLASYPHDLVLIRPTSAAYRFMTRQASWKLIYQDPDCALFVRADSAAAKIPGVPFAGKTGPRFFP